MFLLAKTGPFLGYELWRDGRKVDEYRPVKPKGAPDSRCDELEVKLCGLAPGDELAYRYLYREDFAHCRRNPFWRAEITDLEGQLDSDARARAVTLAADLTWKLRTSSSDCYSEHPRGKWPSPPRLSLASLSTLPTGEFGATVPPRWLSSPAAEAKELGKLLFKPVRGSEMIAPINDLLAAESSKFNFGRCVTCHDSQMIALLPS